MSERQQYEMTAEDLERLLEASRPVPYMVFGGVEPPSPYEAAMAVWRRLGERMGFDPMSVEPVTGQPQTVFTAEPQP